MANNPYVNKVELGGQTIMDISDTDAEESDVAEGKIFYKGTGQRSIGTGSGGGGSSIQVEELPEASATELDNIYQYVGPTVSNYINGFFYQCKSEESIVDRNQTIPSGVSGDWYMLPTITMDQTIILSASIKNSYYILNGVSSGQLHTDVTSIVVHEGDELGFKLYGSVTVSYKEKIATYYWDDKMVQKESLPLGGIVGQALVKHSNSDLDIEWKDIIPNGGTTGQVLAKRSNTDNDIEWQDIIIKTKTSELINDGASGISTYVEDISFVEYTEAELDAIIDQIDFIGG